MKQINFIKTLSPAEHYALALWYRLSSAAIGILLISIIVRQSLQLYTYAHSTRATAQWVSDQESMKQAANGKHTLLQEKQDFEKRLLCMQETEKGVVLPPIFDICIKAVAPLGSIQSLSLRHDYAVCTITCAKPADAISIVHALKKQTLFESVTLTQLRTYQDKIQATIRASIQKN